MDPIREIIAKACDNAGDTDRIFLGEYLADIIVAALHRDGYAIVRQDNVNQWPDE